MSNYWHVVQVLLAVFAADKIHATLDIYYMDELCGTTVDLAEIHSASVETSRALTYPNNLNCVVSFKAPANKKFYVVMKRFITEESSNTCYDYLSMYDGADTTSPTMISELCGELSGEPTYRTSGEDITFEFLSDESAKDRGFAAYIVAFTEGSNCADDEILCDTIDICIDDETSTCDGYEHCPSGSDESLCAASGEGTVGLSQTIIGIIVGVSITGVVLLVIVILVIRWGYRKYQWSQYLKHLAKNKAAAKTLHGQALQSSRRRTLLYPLTHQYQNEEYINITRAQRDAALMSETDIGVSILAAASTPAPVSTSAPATPQPPPDALDEDIHDQDSAEDETLQNAAPTGENLSDGKHDSAVKHETSGHSKERSPQENRNDEKVTEL